MTDQPEPQPDGKKSSVPAASATAAPPKPLIPIFSDAAITAATAKSNNGKKAAAAVTATKAGSTSPSKTSPSTATKYTHLTKGAPVLPPVIHHPYVHHHYYAYHQHMAAANANSADPQKSGIGIKSTHNSVAAAATARGKQGTGASGQPPPPPIYPPPPPPHLPQHHHAYQAWAAYRYAQQHSQYHGGPPPPPPGPPPPWNADAYAAGYQAYAAASKTAAANGKKGNINTGSSGDNGAASTGSVGAAGAPTLPPNHHYPPHGGTVQPPPSGPYRYSDPTLRRDALSRINTTPENNQNNPNGTTATKGSSPSSSLQPHSPPTPVLSSVAKNGVVGGPVLVGANHTPPDPATLHMLELEARAEGATSPSQIEDFHREEVTTMGCTCKKTKCLKLYCQCFAVKIYCGANCRCLTCKNTPQHEAERQDAIRAILSRNPTAFDTKFQKNNRKMFGGMVRPSMIHPGANPNGTGGLVHGGVGAMDIPHARTISHKLGCKCRKSACMKKYCECYAGNVKCSSNCRCIGCKNRAPGDLGPPPPGANNAVANPNVAANVKATPTKHIMTTPVKKEPSWMMNAAQNLTFLKHGSAEKPKRVISRAPSEAGSMPSLASSSEESPVGGGSKTRTKPLPVNGARSIPVPSTAERAAVNALESAEKTAINALLMAAKAMTEMSGHSSSSNSNENRQDASTKNDTSFTSSATTTSPHNTRENNNYSPEAITQAAEVHFETPQRNLLKKFMSPKRKVSDRNNEEARLPSRNLASSDAYRETADDDDDSPKRDHPGDGTPILPQKIKRSRLGSLKKGARLLEREKSNGDLETTSTTNGVLPMEMSTPAKDTGGGKITDLTPVSARCLDFKKMRVNDSSTDPAVVDSVALS